MITPDGIRVTPRILSGKPYLVLTRGNFVVAYVPVRVREEDGEILLADVTVQELRSHGVEAGMLG